MLDLDQLTKGQRVCYRPSPAANETLPGAFHSKAKGREPAAFVLFDGEHEPRICYLSKLELEPKGDDE